MEHSSGSRWLVTANFEQHRRGSRAWLERALVARRPAIVFGQEMPDLAWLRELARAHGYEVIAPGPGVEIRPTWRVVSWLLVDSILEPREVSPDVWELLASHGSYAAAAVVTWPVLGELIVISMHASPNPAASGDLNRYTQKPALVREGIGDQRYEGAIWHSDLFLNALRELVIDENAVPAAGDLNEARRWDETHPGDWGRDFFENVASAGPPMSPSLAGRRSAGPGSIRLLPRTNST